LRIVWRTWRTCARFLPMKTLSVLATDAAPDDQDDLCEGSTAGTSTRFT
jgi:hypothetical protein